MYGPRHFSHMHCYPKIWMLFSRNKLAKMIFNAGVKACLIFSL